MTVKPHPRVTFEAMDPHERVAFEHRAGTLHEATDAEVKIVVDILKDALKDAVDGGKVEAESRAYRLLVEMCWLPHDEEVRRYNLLADAEVMLNGGHDVHVSEDTDWSWIVSCWCGWSGYEHQTRKGAVAEGKAHFPVEEPSVSSFEDRLGDYL
ncbi:MAG: hypothetical protein WD895_03360 [Acidimicrobiia bacterium]